MKRYTLEIDEEIASIKRRAADGKWYGKFWAREHENDIYLMVSELEDIIQEAEKKPNTE